MRLKAKRALSLALALAMCLSCLCVTSFAANEEPAAPQAKVTPLGVADMLMVESLESIDFNDLFDSEFTNRPVLRAGAEFSVSQTGEPTDYDNWFVDFVLSFNKAIDAGAITLYGKYTFTGSEGTTTEYGWTEEKLGAMTADAPHAVLAAENIGPFTYAQVRNNIGSFKCGVSVTGEIPQGTTVSVNLVLTKPNSEKTVSAGHYEASLDLVPPQAVATKLSGDGLVYDYGRLEAGASFSIKQDEAPATSVAYAFWPADFIVTFNKQLTDEEASAISAYGKYGSYDWLGAKLSEVTSDPVEQVVVIRDMLAKIHSGTDEGDFPNGVPYAFIRAYVETFLCGLDVDLAKVDPELTATLQLAVFDPDDLKKPIAIGEELVFPIGPAASITRGEGESAVTTYYLTLAEAMKSVAKGESATIQVLRDVTESLGNVNGGKNITIDANKHSVKMTNTPYVYNGKLTLEDGTFVSTQEQALSVIGHTEDRTETYSYLKISSDATLHSSKWAVTMFSANGSNAYDAVVDVYGKVEGNIFVSGTIGAGDSQVNVYDGAVVTTDVDGVDYAHAIAGNGFATVNIFGGTIIGRKTGVETRAGALNISGGTITGKGTEYSVKPNPSGVTTSGAGVAIAQHTTRLQMNTSITGGTISGLVGLSIANPQANTVENMNVAVEGGVFNGDVNFVCYDGDTGKAVKNFDTRIAKFISDGYFNTDPAKWIVDGKVTEKLTSGDYNGYWHLTDAAEQVIVVVESEDGATVKTEPKVIAAGVNPEEKLEDIVGDDNVTETIDIDNDVTTKSATVLATTQSGNGDQKFVVKIITDTVTSTTQETETTTRTVQDVPVTVKSVDTTVKTTSNDELTNTIDANNLTTLATVVGQNQDTLKAAAKDSEEEDTTPTVAVALIVKDTTEQSVQEEGVKVYNVYPEVTISDGIENSENKVVIPQHGKVLAEPETFKLPVEVKHNENMAKVTHKAEGTGDVLSTDYLPIQGTAGKEYVEITSDTFSTFELIPVQIGNTGLSASLSLNDQIEANFYLSGNVPDQLNQVKITISAPYGRPDRTFTFNRTAAAAAAGMSVPVYSMEMKNDITIEMLDASGAKLPFQSGVYQVVYSVDAYHQAIKESGSATKAQKDLVIAMGTYGEYAKNYFDIKYGGQETDLSPAIALTEEELTAINNDVSGATASGNMAIRNLYAKSTLSMDETTAVRHYFNIPRNEIEQYTFTYSCGGTQTLGRLGYYNGQYYVDSKGLGAANLDKEVTLTVSKDGADSWSVTCTPLLLIKLSENSNDVNSPDPLTFAGVKLFRALYRYSKAAEVVFPNS